LSDIKELDENFLFPENSVATCRDVAEHTRLIQEAELAHPIILATDGRVMDGMRRHLSHSVVSFSWVSHFGFEEQRARARKNERL